MDLNGWDWYPRSGCDYSRRWAATFGTSWRKSSRPSDFYPALHPDDRPVLMEQLTRHLEGHSPSYESDTTFAQDRAMEMGAGPGQTVERDAAGHPLQFRGFASISATAAGRWRRWKSGRFSAGLINRWELQFEDLFNLDEIQKSRMPLRKPRAWLR